MRVLIRADASFGIGVAIGCVAAAWQGRCSVKDREVRWCGRVPEGTFCEGFALEFFLLLLPPDNETAIDPAHGSWLPMVKRKMRVAARR